MPEKNVRFDELIENILEILRNKADREEKFRANCKLLKANVPYYDWVGFYFTNNSRPEELILGPFEGVPQSTLRYLLGAVYVAKLQNLGKLFVVQDVSKETNYLSCNASVKAEFVTPIFKNGAAVGEIDIDSHIISPFTMEDEVFLKKITEMLSEFF